MCGALSDIGLLWRSERHKIRIGKNCILHHRMEFFLPSPRRGGTLDTTQQGLLMKLLWKFLKRRRKCENDRMGKIHLKKKKMPVTLQVYGNFEK